jgi:hypothetical protein
MIMWAQGEPDPDFFVLVVGVIESLYARGAEEPVGVGADTSNIQENEWES